MIIVFELEHDGVYIFIRFSFGIGVRGRYWVDLSFDFAQMRSTEMTVSMTGNGVGAG